MSNYILDLRKTVGHRPLLQVGASVIVEDRNGRILLQQRSDDRSWGYAGGSVELYENVEAAARRELLEETGLQAGNMELFGIYSGEDMRFVYPNRDEVSNVDIVFLCKDYAGTLRAQDGEVDQLAWFSASELPTPLFAPNQPAIRDWVEKNAAPKTDYKALTAQLRELIRNVPHPVANLANAAALLWESIRNINWVGFYLLEGDRLALGPFQGKPACIEIPLGKGVCGTAAEQDRTLVVADVHAFEGHIACDSASNSEIVVPIRQNGRVVAVLDVDSPVLGRFTNDDRIGLESLARILETELNGSLAGGAE